MKGASSPYVYIKPLLKGGTFFSIGCWLCYAFKFALDCYRSRGQASLLCLGKKNALMQFLSYCLFNEILGFRLYLIFDCGQIVGGQLKILDKLVD